MNSKSTFLLLLVAAMVVGGFYFARERIPSSDELAEKQKRVLDLKASEVTEVRIKGADRDFLFERKKNQWRFKTPLQVRANAGEIEGILSKLEFMERRRTLTPKDLQEVKLTLTDYGLAKPRLVATFKTKARVISLNVGNEVRQGDGVYVQVAEEPNVHLVGKDFAMALDKKLEDYREKSLFDFSSSEVQRLEIKNGSKLLEFCRTNTQWRIIQPLNARADSGKLDSFLQQTVSLQAGDFLSEDPAASKEYGLEEPSQEVSVKLNKEDAVRTLLIGARLKNDDKKMAVKVKGENSIVSVVSSYAAEVARPLNDFRDRHLPSFAQREVAEIELRTRQVSTVVQREKDEWKIVQPEKMAADADLAQKMLSKLESIEIKDFTADVATDLDKYGLKPPVSSIILRGKPTAGGEAGTTNAVQSAILELEIGKSDPAKKLVFVRLANESAVYGMDLADLAELPKAPVDLRSRILFEVKKDAVKSCTQKKGKTTVTIEPTADKKWKLGENTQGVLDETTWLKFVNNLEKFRVEKIIGTAVNTTAKQYGFENPGALITIQAEAGGKLVTHELLTGRDGAQKKYYLLWKNQLLTAEITPDFYQILTRDWVTVPAPKK